MAGRARASTKTPKRPAPPRDPTAAIAGLGNLNDEIACLAIVWRTRKVFKPRRAV